LYRAGLYESNPRAFGLEPRARLPFFPLTCERARIVLGVILITVERGMRQANKTRSEARELLLGLRSRGKRLTDQRRVILEVVRSTDAHPTAGWVYREVKKRVPRISLGTVYRNLKLLSGEGLLSEIQTGYFTRYDAKLESHHHFTCLVCGRIFDLDEPVDQRQEARLSSRTGFEVSSHRIEFFGRCATCVGRRRPSRSQPRG